MEMNIQYKKLQIMDMKQQIINKIKEHYKKSQSRALKKLFLQNPDVEKHCNDIINNIPWFQTPRNVIIAIAHDIYEIVLCKNCNNPLKVEKAIYGKHIYCCKQCADESPEKLQKQKQTCIKLYGAQTPLLNAQCKKKTIKTCREKFNNDMFAGSKCYRQTVSSPFNNEEVRKKSIETKKQRYGDDFGKVIFEKSKLDIQQTNIEKYGVPYVLMNKKKFNETKETMQQKYNSDNYFSSYDCLRRKNKRSYKKILSWNEFVKPLFTFDEYKGKSQIYKWKCTKCGNIFESKIYFTGLGKNRQIPRCEICFPNQATSIAEKELADFIKSIYNDKVLTNDRALLKQYELDIVLPQINLAIEFNGIYWHSLKDKNYHLHKTELCQKKGYRLIHIWQDEWIDDKYSIMNKLKSIIENNEIIKENKLDRCWYSTLQFQKYKKLPPELISRGKCKIWNCGYLIVD